MSLKFFIPLVAWTTAASAQPVEHPAIEPEQPVASPGPAASLDLAVAIVAAPDELAADEVRAALATELGVRIIDSDNASAAIGRLTVTLENATLRVVYQAVDGRRIERSVAAPVLEADRVQLVAFIASNLVRDQVSEILAGLPRPAPVTPAAAPVPAPAPSVVARPPATYLPVTFGLVPPIAVDRIAGSQVIVGMGLHLLVGMTDGADLASVSGLVDVQRQYARGLQLGGLGVSAGRLDRGLQVGGLAALARTRADGVQIGGVLAMSGGDTRGIQVGGVGSISSGSTHGLQIGGLGSISSGNTRGIQVGGLVSLSSGETRALQIGGLGSVSYGDTFGIQVGGVASLSSGETRALQIGGVGSVSYGDMVGIQVGGVATIARSMRGLQIGGVTSIARDVSGLQVGGVATVGNDVAGAQLGLVNVARRMRGVQIGLINISEDGDDAIPIGLLNVARNGRVEVDGWVESTRFSAIGLRHGPRRIQNMIALAWSPDHDHLLAGFGLGLHHRLSEGPDPVTLDIDAVNWWTDLWHGETAQLDQLRATIALPVGSVDLIAGAAANIYISEGMDESANFHPIAARRLTGDDTSIHVVTWPSVFAGVRMRAR